MNLFRAKDPWDVHVQMLCNEHKITRVVKPGRGHAKVADRRIQHPPLDEEMAYLVALHEVGHVLVGLQGTRLEREALAWKFALDNALAPPHYSTRQRICACLVRYIHRAQHNGWKLPAKGDLFWDLMRWWVPLSVDGSGIEPDDSEEDTETDQSQDDAVAGDTAK